MMKRPKGIEPGSAGSAAACAISIDSDDDPDPPPPKAAKQQQEPEDGNDDVVAMEEAPPPAKNAPAASSSALVDDDDDVAFLHRSGDLALLDYPHASLFHRAHAALASELAHAKQFSECTSVSGTQPAEEIAAAYNAVWSLRCMETCADERTLFAAIKRWALELLSSPPALEPLPLGSSRDLSAAHCRGILANAMLGNVADVMSGSKRHNGGLDFSRQLLDVHRVRSSVAAHKTAALLHYFSQQLSIEGTADDERTVTFERVECPSMEEMSSMLEGATEVPLLPSDGVCQDDIRLHAGTMEAAWKDEPNCRGFVNFANADFGYGCFISSATQEEILQVCCPEFNVGLIFLGRMSDDEVINVYGKSTQLLSAQEAACVL
jgi:hypothetical protein